MLTRARRRAPAIISKGIVSLVVDLNLIVDQATGLRDFRPRLAILRRGGWKIVGTVPRVPATVDNFVASLGLLHALVEISLTPLLLCAWIVEVRG